MQRVDADSRRVDESVGDAHEVRSWGYGFATQGLGYAPEGAILAGSGTRASTLVPTSSEQPLQILDIHTGLGTVLPPPGATEKTHNIEVTSDGFIVLDLSTKQGTVLDSREPSNPVSRLTGTHFCPQSAVTATSRAPLTSRPS